MRKNILIILALIVGMVVGVYGTLQFKQNNIIGHSFNVTSGSLWQEPTDEPETDEPSSTGSVPAEIEEEQEIISEVTPEPTPSKPAEKDQEEYKPGPIIFPPPKNLTTVDDSIVEENSLDKKEESNNRPPVVSSDGESKTKTNEEKLSASNGSDKNTEIAPYSPSPEPATSAPSNSKGVTYGENLQYTKSGQMFLGAPQDSRNYPIIANESPYGGKINFSGDLSQSEIKRLMAYKPTAVAEWNDTTSKPIGAYENDAEFKKTVDYFISNMGPHIERKLKTTEWEFTPVPMAAYEVQNFIDMFGHVVIRGVLKVKYSDVNNPLMIEPGVWYQGDVELGMSSVAFFTNNPQDRTPRIILNTLVVLGSWGQI